MNFKIACLIVSLTLVPSLISCSSNSQNETAATTTTSAVDNPIECKYMYFKTKDCKPSTPSSPIALSQNTYKPELSSNISTPESSIHNLVSNILSDSINLASPPNQLSSNPVNQTQNSANSTSPSRRSNSNSNLVTPNNVTQLTATNRQVQTSNYNLDYTNNNQATFPGVTNSPKIEFSQPTVATGVTTKELPLPSSRNNNLVKASQTQVQTLPPPRNLQLPTNQLNAELTPNKIQESIPYFTPQQVSNNQINSNLNTNRLPVPLSTSNYPNTSQQIAPVASNNDSQSSFSTSSNQDYFVDTIEPQLNPTQLQPKLNLSPNQVNPVLNNNQIPIQSPATEKTLQSSNNQQNSSSQSLIKSEIQEIHNSNSELGTITKNLPQKSW